MTGREERQRILDDIDERLGEALVAHSMSDDESEEAVLDMALDEQQQQLERLWHDDPVGCIWAGDDDD
jgi:hypothetical protein